MQTKRERERERERGGGGGGQPDRPRGCGSEILRQEI